MKLLELLTEATDREELIYSAAQEFGYARPKVYPPKGKTINDVIDYAIDLYRLHQDTDGSANVFMRLSNIVRDAPKPDELHEPLEHLEYFSDMSLGQSASYAAVKTAYEQMLAHGSDFKDLIEGVNKFFMIFNGFMSAAYGNHYKQNNDSRHAYLQSIAKATLKQLGIPLKEI